MRLIQILTSVFIVSFLISESFAQDIKIIDWQPAKIIMPFYYQKAMQKIDTLKIKVYVKDKDTAKIDSSLNLFILEQSSFPNNPKLENDSLKKKKRSFMQPDSTVIYSVILITSYTPDTLIDDQIAHIVIKGQEGFYTVRLSSKGLYDPNKPFWVEAGANFDLIDGLKPNNLFFGVFLYDRDIRHLCKNHGSDNLGMFAGVFESKAVSTNSASSFDIKTYYNTNSLTHPSHDSAYIFKDVGQINVTQEVRNVGLFFSPQLRLSNNSSNTNGVHFFFSFWAEIQWQQIRNTFDYSQMKRIDTINISINNILSYESLNPSTHFEVYTHYEGIGFPIFLKKDDVNLFFNPIIGLSNQIDPTTLRNNSDFTYAALNRSWRSFYLVQFRLNEEKNGIAFSGEVRGLLQKGNQPFVTLVLSKKFDLSKLIAFK